MGKSQIAIRIPPSLLAELNPYVEQTSTSKTDVAVSAIAQYLGCTEMVPLNQRVAVLEAEIEELRTWVKKIELLEV